MKIKNKSLFKNIGLIIFSTLFLVLSIFTIFINVNARKIAFNTVHADTTTTNFYGSNFYVPQDFEPENVNTFLTYEKTNVANLSGNLFVLDDMIFSYSSGSTFRLFLFDENENFTSLRNSNFVDVDTNSNIYPYISIKIFNISNDYYMITGSTWASLSLYKYTFTSNLSGSTYKFYFDKVDNFVLPVTSVNAAWNITYCFNTINNYLCFFGNNLFMHYDFTSNSWVDFGFDFTNVSSYLTSTNCVDFFYYKGNYYLFNGYANFYLNGNTFTIISNYVGDYVTVLGRRFFPVSTVSGSRLIAFADNYNFIFDGSNNTLGSIYRFNFSNGANVDAWRVVYFNNRFYLSIATSSGYGSVCSWSPDIFTKGHNHYLTLNSFNFVELQNNTFNLSISSFLYNPIYNDFSYAFINQFYETSSSSFIDSLNFPFNSSTIFRTLNLRYYFNGQFYNSNISLIVDNLSSLNFSYCIFSSVVSDYSSELKLCSNSLTYYDNSNGYIKFTFNTYMFQDSIVYFNATNSSTIFDFNEVNLAFSTRTYYFLDNTDAYSSGYNTGYTAGYNTGDTDGYNRGYTTGYNTGDTDGYYRGYNDGGNSANTYSFLGLISAVIDAPIKAFTGLFNFNLLGVNMVSFITALFTLAVIITIIKKVV